MSFRPAIFVKILTGPTAKWSKYLRPRMVKILASPSGQNTDKPKNSKAVPKISKKTVHTIAEGSETRMIELGQNTYRPTRSKY